MRPSTRHQAAAATALLCLTLAGGAVAADNEAGVPLSPRDAAGAWTIEQQGRAVCVVKLSSRRSGADFVLSSGPQCGDTLEGAAGWKPTADGLAITGADGQTLIAFNRWSNSLFVSHRSSGVDLQLKRGTPGAMPGTD
jgi:hypothetical protein